MPESSHQVCDRCRHKKIKCDGSPGGCQPCRKANIACIVSTKLSKRSVSKSYVDSLVDRIALLEQTIRQHHEAAISTSERPDLPILPPTGRPGRLGRLVDTPTGSRELLGASTGIFFLEHALHAHVRAFPAHAESVTRLVPATLCSPCWHGGGSGGSGGSRLTGDLQLTNLDPGMLEHATAMRLVDVFCMHTASTFPLLHKPTVIQLLHDQSSPPPIERALLYCCFALGLRVSGTGSAVADAYAASARSLRRHLTFRPTLLDLQVLLLGLLVDLEWNEKHAVLQSWGEATRIALALGLNVHSKQFDLGQLETEMRNRVFWCCYMLDVFLSARTGLPSCFRDADLEVGLPAEIEDDRLEEAYQHDPIHNRATNMSRFVVLCRLVCTLHSINVSFGAAVMPGEAADIVRRQSERLEQLRPHLELDLFDRPDASSQLTPFHIFAHALYTYTQWSLHCAVVSRGIDDLQSSSSLHAATRAAIKLIQVQPLAEADHCLRGLHPAHQRETIFLAGTTILLSQWQSQWQPRHDDGENINLSTAASLCQDAIHVLRSQGPTHVTPLPEPHHASVLTMLLQLTTTGPSTLYGSSTDATYSDLSLHSPTASTSRSQSASQSQSNSASAPASVAPSPSLFTTDTPHASLALPSSSLYAPATSPAGPPVYSPGFSYAFTQMANQSPALSLWQPPSSEPPSSAGPSTPAYTTTAFHLEPQQPHMYPAFQHSWNMPLGPDQRAHLLGGLGAEATTLDHTIGMFPAPAHSSHHSTPPQPKTDPANPRALWPGPLTDPLAGMSQVHLDSESLDPPSQLQVQLQLQARTQAQAQSRLEPQARAGQRSHGTNSDDDGSGADGHRRRHD